MTQGTSEADAAVAAELGVGEADTDAGVEQEGQEEHEGQEPKVEFDDLPDWAQDEIKRLRAENARTRVKARDAARKVGNGDGQQPEASKQALKAAEDRGRNDARMEFGVRLAGAEVRASLAGVLSNDQIVSVVEDLDLTRFVDDDGEVDAEAVAALKDKYTALLGKKPPAKVGHGRRESPPVSKSTADQFADALGPLLG